MDFSNDNRIKENDKMSDPIQKLMLGRLGEGWAPRRLNR